LSAQKDSSNILVQYKKGENLMITF
jgi:hypothetical protein